MGNIPGQDFTAPQLLKRPLYTSHSYNFKSVGKCENENEKKN